MFFNSSLLASWVMGFIQLSVYYHFQQAIIVRDGDIDIVEKVPGFSDHFINYVICIFGACTCCSVLQYYWWMDDDVAAFRVLI